MANETIRILQIDDCRDDYVLTRAFLDELAHWSFQLDWEWQYEKALALIQEDKYDIYLVDYRLGAHDGLGLIQKAVKDGCQKPLILLTGQGDREIDLKAMEIGAADYLQKEMLNAALLERSIRYACQHKKMEAALRNAETLETIQQLAGAIAHEFSQPLQTLVFQLTLMEPNVSDKAMFKECYDMTDRIISLVTKLRNITKIEKQPYMSETYIMNLHASADSKKEAAN